MRRFLAYLSLQEWQSQEEVHPAVECAEKRTWEDIFDGIFVEDGMPGEVSKEFWVQKDSREDSRREWWLRRHPSSRLRWDVISTDSCLLSSMALLSLNGLVKIERDRESRFFLKVLIASSVTLEDLEITFSKWLPASPSEEDDDMVIFASRSTILWFKSPDVKLIPVLNPKEGENGMLALIMLLGYLHPLRFPETGCCAWVVGMIETSVEETLLRSTQLSLWLMSSDSRRWDTSCELFMSLRNWLLK